MAAGAAGRGIGQEEFLCGFCRHRLPEELGPAVPLLGFREGSVPLLAADSVRRPRVVVQAGLAVQFLESFGGPPAQGEAQLRQKKVDVGLGREPRAEVVHSVEARFLAVP